MNIRNGPHPSAGGVLALVAALVVSLALLLVACGGESHEGREGQGEHGGEASGEHGSAGEGSEHDEGDEESGDQFGLDETYDKTRAGTRLIISYDAAANAFTGTVENTTTTTLERVRVEVHLSNGTELGPTTPTDLAPGQKVPVTLAATSEAFESWSAHPEVGGGDGSGEHGSDGEDRGEHS